MTSIKFMQQLFGQHFVGEPSLIVRAPGRINLIGEHTDYNDGFVLPVAVKQSVWIACRKRDDTFVDCFSSAFETPLKFSVDRIRKEPGYWGEYIKGVAWGLKRSGYLVSGWEGVLHGDIPIGAGLSSSAAIEIAALRAFGEVSDIRWDPFRMAKLGQRAETDWVGVDSGIMDQMISILARPGEALLIDCRTLDIQSVSVPSSLAILAIDTGTRRDLVDTRYNQRHIECEQAAEILGIRSLRDLTADEYKSVERNLSDLLRRRAKHVIHENERTLQAAKALQDGDVKLLGALINESHFSLRDDFEVSNPELDIIVSITQEQEGCYGARMTGAGFGGFAVALVDRSRIAELSDCVESEYLAQTGIAASVIEFVPSGGVEVMFEEKG